MAVAVLMLRADPVVVGPVAPAAPAEPAGPEAPVVPEHAPSQVQKRIMDAARARAPRTCKKIPFAQSIRHSLNET
jgi:hypothetical protein